MTKMFEAMLKAKVDSTMILRKINIEKESLLM